MNFGRLKNEVGLGEEEFSSFSFQVTGCHWSLVIGHWSLVIGHSSLFGSLVIGHSPFAVRRSPFAIRHSPFAIRLWLGIGQFSVFECRDVTDDSRWLNGG